MNRQYSARALPLICAGLLILTVAASLEGQSLPPRAEFDPPVFKFDLTITNHKGAPKRIVRVGVKSDLRSGSFACRISEEPKVLLPLADYRIKFHVKDKETIINAEPPLVIPSPDVARFSISVIPLELGACGIWATDISPIVDFDDGERFYGRPELVTSADLARYLVRKPREQEILDGLKHRSAEIKIQSIRQLSGTSLDNDEIRIALEAKLDDPETDVRVEASRVAARMDFKSLAGKIALVLKASHNNREIAEYCQALGALREPGTIDVLIGALLNPIFDDYLAAVSALVNMAHPDVPLKVRPLLLQHTQWSLKTASAEQNLRYARICEILIRYGDTQSIPLLSKIITDRQHAEVAPKILTTLLSLTHEDQTVQDPFLLALRAPLEEALAAPDQLVRANALELLCRMPPRKDSLERVLRIGLQDPEKSVRIKAAVWIAQLRYRSLTVELCSLVKSSADEEEKASYRKALVDLKVNCT